MSFALSYKDNTTSPTLFSSGAHTAYATSSKNSASPQNNDQYLQVRPRHPAKAKAGSAAALSHRKPKSILSVSTRKSSMYDALSLIDTYMCDPEAMDFPLSDNINPFAPLPGLDIGAYANKERERKREKKRENSDNIKKLRGNIEKRSAQNGSYESIFRTIEESLDADSTLTKQEDLRKSVISRVFSEHELIQLGNIFGNILEEGAEGVSKGLISGKQHNSASNGKQQNSISNDKWDDECPTKVNGSPNTIDGKRSAKLLTKLNIEYPDDEITPANSDDETTEDGKEFGIPVGVDRSPLMTKLLYRSSVVSHEPITQVTELRERPKDKEQKAKNTKTFEFSKAVDNHFPSGDRESSSGTIRVSSTTPLQDKPAKDKNKNNLQVLKSIIKIRSKLEFSKKEVDAIQQSWDLIKRQNQNTEFNSLNIDGHKSLFKEKSSHNKDENLSAYSFTKQFYNNLFRQMSFIKRFFPNSTTKRQVVAFGNILSECIKNLDDLDAVKKFLLRNRYLNQERDPERCCKTIFGYSSFKVEENEVYFSIFGKIFLRTLNENFPKEFLSELEEAWSKFYLFLFSCIVGGLKRSELSRLTKTKSRVDFSNTTNIDDTEIIGRQSIKSDSFHAIEEDIEAFKDHSGEKGSASITSSSSTITVAAPSKANTTAAAISTAGGDSSSNDGSKIAFQEETPFSVMAYRTSPATVNAPTMKGRAGDLTESSPPFKKPTLKKRFHRSGSNSYCFGKKSPSLSFGGSHKENFFQKMHHKLNKSPTFVLDAAGTNNASEYVTNGKKIEKKVNQSHLNNAELYEGTKLKDLSLDDIKLLSKLKMVKDMFMSSKVFNKKLLKSNRGPQFVTVLSSPSSAIDNAAASIHASTIPKPSTDKTSSPQFSDLVPLDTLEEAILDQPITSSTSIKPQQLLYFTPYSSPKQKIFATSKFNVQASPRIHPNEIERKISSSTLSPVSSSLSNILNVNPDVSLLPTPPRLGIATKPVLYSHENTLLRHEARTESMFDTNLDAPVFDHSLSEDIFNHQQLKPIFVNCTCA